MSAGPLGPGGPAFSQRLRWCCVSKAGELEDSVHRWLAGPAPALQHVKVKPMQLVTPPSPSVSPEAVIGMTVYTAKAILQGKDRDVCEMIVENS